MPKFLKYLAKTKDDFFKINQTSLTGLSKLLMILFFLTSLWLISFGINSSIVQAIPPSKEYGYKCVSLAEKEDFRLYDFRDIGWNKRDFGTSEECKVLKNLYTVPLRDFKVQSALDQEDSLRQRLYQIRSKKTRVKKEYSNALLEKIANQKKDKSILHSSSDTAKEQLQNFQRQENTLLEKLDEIKDIDNYKSIREFLIKKNAISSKILSDYAAAKRWYVLKVNGQIFAFIIPIWMLFFFLYRYLEKKEKYIFAKLSYYVSAAAALYGLAALVELIYSVIPKVFLGKIIAFFLSHNMIIVLNIIGILFFLALFGLLIHKIQKNHEKNKFKRDSKVLNLKKGCCLNCSLPREPGDMYCKFCGTELKKVCKKCNSVFWKGSVFCSNCGEEDLS